MEGVYKKSAFFDISRFIQETIRDMALVATGDWCAIYRMVAFPITLSDPLPRFQGHDIIQRQII